MADYVSSPAEAIRQKFSISLTGGQNEPPIPPFSLGAGGFTQEAIPPPISQEEIQRQFAPLIQEAQGEGAPTPREAPSPLNPWMVFAGALAANMGSSLTKNPLFAQQFAQHLEDQQKRQQTIQDENYANDLLFNREKRTRLFAIRGQALETALKAAIDSNDTERAAAIAQNLEKLRLEGEKQLIAPKQAAEEHGIRVKGEEERKLERLKIQAEKEKTTKATATKPLTMDQYQDNIRQAMQLKPEQLQTVKPPWWHFGMGEQHIEKSDYLEVKHAEAAVGGEPEVKAAARGNLVRSIAKRLGIRNPANMTDNEAALMKAEFAKMGVPF